MALLAAALLPLLNRPTRPAAPPLASAPPVDRTAPPATHAPPPTEPTTLVAPDDPLEPATLNDLLDLPRRDLHRVDIARLNLLAASALPATADLDVEHALRTLDRWAQQVADATDRHLYRLADPRFADRYQGSEPHLRAELLAQVLVEDLGVKYDPTALGNFSFQDPAVAFIHGMIPTALQQLGHGTADTPGGTCASMPVLYVAVGRRLGYPLYLATTDSHVFARWDGTATSPTGQAHPNPAWQERFNCETTNGFTRIDDDAHYLSFPFPVSDEQARANRYLESLTPRAELALFLAARGHHALDNQQRAFAARCYENAANLDPTRPAYAAWFTQAARGTGYRPRSPRLAAMLDAPRGPTLAELPRRYALDNDLRRLQQPTYARTAPHAPALHQSLANPLGGPPADPYTPSRPIDSNFPGATP
ncbi:MAG: hypothetical protein AAGI54_03750 [Planctomycetota bacterium]